MEPATVPLQNLPAYAATVSDVISHLYDLGQAGWPLGPPFPQLGSGMGWAQQSLVMPVHCQGPGGWGWTRAQGMLGGFGESRAALPPSVPGPGASSGPRCLENSAWIPQVGCSNMYPNGEGSLGGVGWWQAVLSPHGVCVCVCVCVSILSEEHCLGDGVGYGLWAQSVQGLRPRPPGRKNTATRASVSTSVKWGESQLL